MEAPRILHALRKAYWGPAWHGPSVAEVLKSIDHTTAGKKMGQGHSIITLVGHMIAWRQFTIKKIQGDVNYEVPKEVNFPSYPNEITQADWEKTLQQLEESQKTLEELVASQEEDWLDQSVEGRSYSFYVLIHGVIQHDLYHTGQIVLLHKYS